MGLTFQQKFYHIGDAVFIVHSKAHGGNCKVVALVEIPDDEKEAQEVENRLKKHGFVEKMNFDEVIMNGNKILRG